MDGNYEAGEGLREFLEEAELTQYDELFRAILKVNKLSQLKYVEVGDLAHIGLSKPEQRRYKSVYNKYFPNPYFTVLKRLLARNRKNDLYLQGQEAVSVYQPFSENAVRVPTKHIISVEDITINKELGMGQFGVVQQGTWTTGNQRLQVAIKCLGQERMTSNSTEFLKEAAVMHSIEHPSIVRLYGVVLHMDSLMLVTELAPLRSLLECLREVSLRPNFPVPTLCEFAEQICSGMTYLERKRLIHRDLAARNILVFSKDRVKISDFGLSRALGVGKDYYQTNYNVNLKLPVAWCAPECILYLRFTSSSDVWAYGVCLWEMFTYGFQPWAAFSGQQILEAIDAPNFHRLERPECCPEGYYKLMLSCWSQEPNDRPKFKEMEVGLKDLRPDQVQAIADSTSAAEEQRTNELEYKAGQIITVLGKGSTRWYGVVPGGACGYFSPKNIMPKYFKSESPSLPGCSMSSSRAASLRPCSLRPMVRGDVTRHTTGRRTLHRSMISSPQGEVVHTGHVGLDGAYFGDISFLDPAGCPPQMVVNPYRPCEDLEQVPLINPNSPSHATGATSTPPYPLLSPEAEEVPRNLSQPSRNLPDQSRPLPHSLRTLPEASDHLSEPSRTLPQTSRNQPQRSRLLPQPSGNLPQQSSNQPQPSRNRLQPPANPQPVPSVPKGGGFLSKVRSSSLMKSLRSEPTVPVVGLHEYHEISDTDTESTATETVRGDHLTPESPNNHKSEFSQSILDEMDAMFKTLENERDASASTSKAGPSDRPSRSHTLNKQEKKKGFTTGTMKPMSAHDKKTLDSAVALANELTTRSMNDLGSEQKPPASPEDKSKFYFRFPSLSISHHHEEPKEQTGKTERRNFSQEAASVPNIVESLTAECLHAYEHFIEQPSSRDLAADELSQRHHPAAKTSAVSPSCDQRQPPDGIDQCASYVPLPPRTNKPKLVDKPRHIRRYPLVNPAPPAPPAPRPPRHNQYVNYSACRQAQAQYLNVASGQDVCDGRDAVASNPFEWMEKGRKDEACALEPDFGCILNDHVSVEDLLEFADQKPNGRQRGLESDEVRIMSKVLKGEASLEECLEALELCEWSVHSAIKALRVRHVSGAELPACARALAAAAGDVARAGAHLAQEQTPP